MSGNKRHNRNHRDANERALIELAASLGAHWVEEGPLDGWAWIPRMGKWMPVEIKAPEKEGLRHEFTPLQRRFFSRCELLNAPHWTWRTSADVLRDLGC